MRQFLIAVVVVWILACIAAFLYSHQQNIPDAVTAAVLPAFLAELAFYLLPGFTDARRAFSDIGPKGVRATALLASAVLPYVLVSVALGRFSLPAFALLLAICAVASFWYVVARGSPFADFLFLAFMAAVFISHVFVYIYGRPLPHLPLDILGRLMWIRVGLLSVLAIRRLEGVKFGFVPSSDDWRIGVQQFGLFLPAGAALAYGLHFVHFQPAAVAWWKYPLIGVGTFFGVLWVLAVGEEFFFRGFLQQLLSRGLRSNIAGLIAASALFGLAHLPFRSFPNWRFAALAAVAGLFYGIAFLRAGSVRASIVTHALVVTTWRLFFKL